MIPNLLAFTIISFSFSSTGALETSGVPKTGDRMVNMAPQSLFDVLMRIRGEQMIDGEKSDAELRQRWSDDIDWLDAQRPTSEIIRYYTLWA